MESKKKKAEEAAQKAFLDEYVVLQRRQIEPILQWLLKQGPMGEVAPLFNTLQRAHPVTRARPQQEPEDIPEDIQELLEEEEKTPRLHVPGG